MTRSTWVFRKDEDGDDRRHGKQGKLAPRPEERDPEALDDVFDGAMPAEIAADETAEQWKARWSARNGDGE